MSDEGDEIPNPYNDLDPEAESWDQVLHSDPYTCWEFLIKTFSGMNSKELKLQREAFEKARMQSKEVRDKAVSKEGKQAAEDIFEILLVCEKAAKKAPPKLDETKFDE